MLIIFEPSGNIHDTQSQLFITSDLQNYSKQFDKNPQSLRGIYYLGKYQNLKIENIGTNACRTILEIRPIHS